MRVLVTGGTGRLGSEVVRLATAAGHEVLLGTRDLASAPDGTSPVRLDLQSGEGLGAALAGVEVVVHSATGGFGKSRQVDLEGTRLLIEASRQAGVGHFVYPSIVGIDEVQTRYYKIKRQAEGLVEASGLPHTILRATQFHALVDRIYSKVSNIPLVLMAPLAFQFQPVAASDVAGFLVDQLADGPGGRVPEVGGPEVHSLGDLGRSWLVATGRMRALVSMRVPGRIARALYDGKLTTPDRAVGTVTWADWLARRYAPRQLTAVPE